jgi:protein involved in polysaccharide export with SLBB domain
MISRSVTVFTFAAALYLPALAPAMQALAPANSRLQAPDDNTIRVNDLLTIELHDLLGPGLQTVKTTRVTESGMISLPMIGKLKAQGLKLAELEAAIQKAYRDAKVAANVQVKVTIGEWPKP